MAAFWTPMPVTSELLQVGFSGPPAGWFGGVEADQFVDVASTATRLYAVTAYGRIRVVGNYPVSVVAFASNGEAGGWVVTQPPARSLPSATLRTTAR